MADPTSAPSVPGPAVEPDGRTCRSWRETLVALAAAVVTVVAMGALTNRLEPTWYFYDEQAYLKMAVEGVQAVKPVTAPFAYRPGTTMLAGAVARIAHVPPARAYAGIAAVALPLFLLCLYALARAYTPSRWRAGIATLLVAFSYSAMKRLIFNPIGPDALGLLLTAVACLLLVQRRYLLLALCTTLGVTCREFVIVPAVAAAIAARGTIGWRAPRSLRPLLPLVGGLLAALLVRLVIRVDVSNQHLDPLTPSTWHRALLVFDERWLVNDVGALATFLWPLLCVPWRSAPAAASADPPAGGAPGPGRLPAWAVTYGALLFVITLFAGTNFVWFAAYFAPLLVVAWVLKGPPRAFGLDLVLLGLVVAVNHTVEPIPSPRDFQNYVSYMSFYSSNLDLHTGVRALVIAAAATAYMGLAALWRERARPGGPAGPP
ncbi:MAG: hypothetical protein HY906_10770 [Deltaproteobacteria bacterium]|nr:hypothetical protein [Deltaproteobacteria bacterium]